MEIQKYMNKKDKLLQIIFETIDEINMQRPSGMRLKKSVNEKLFGAGNLDSLSTVNFIVSLEQKIQDGFGEHVVLTNEKLLGGDAIFDVKELLKYLLDNVGDKNE